VKVSGKRAHISVAVCIILLGLVTVPVVDQFIFRYGWARQTLEDIEARYARLLGLRDAAPRLQQTLAQTVAVLDRHAYPIDTGADRIGADLQQRVRRIAEATSVAVVGSQILPPRSVAGLEIIAMAATFDAEVGSLRDFLLALSAEKPSIQVDSLNVATTRQRGAATGSKVRVQINVSAIHMLP
jgi:general secretion pathway protein M